MLEVASDIILQTFGNCEEQVPEKPVGHQSADWPAADGWQPL